MLTDAQLKNAGVESKEDRKIVLKVIKKACFKSSTLSIISDIPLSIQLMSEIWLLSGEEWMNRSHERYGKQDLGLISWESQGLRELL